MNYKSRFSGLISSDNGINGFSNAEPEESYTDSKEDPWAKLSANISQMNFDIIRHNTKMCPRCKSKMEYISLGEYRCPACRYLFLDDYGKIRDYIDRHGPSTALEIERETGVPRAVADEYLRSGKLEIVKGPEGYLRCEICGADIRYGRICPKCARTDGAKMKGYYVDDVGESPYGAKDAGEMLFLKRRRDRIDSSFKRAGMK